MLNMRWCISALLESATVVGEADTPMWWIYMCVCVCCVFFLGHSVPSENRHMRQCKQRIIAEGDVLVDMYAK